MRTALTFVCLFTLLQGCVKETSWPVTNAPAPKIIVNAILTDEVRTHEISLTYTVTSLNEKPQPVIGAGVAISDEDSTWVLNENPADPGLYLTSPVFFARQGKNYTLLISLNGNIYSAKAAMVPGAYFRELKYARNEGTSLYHISWVANAFGTVGAAAMWELKLDWSKVPGYEHLDSIATHARMLFYTLPTLDVSEVFAPQVESVLFPAGTIIAERRYSLAPAHAGFIRELLLETAWTGGLFNGAAANVTTNLSNGAMGFFGVCAVNELSVTVNPGNFVKK